MKRHILSLNCSRLALIMASVIAPPPFMALDAIINVKGKAANEPAESLGIVALYVL